MGDKKKSKSNPILFRWAIIIVVLGVLFLLTALFGVIQWFSDTLRIIPAPTDNWATIIGHLAWPLTIAWLVVRFKHSLRKLLEIVLSRFETDHVKTPLFELTPQSPVLVLDPAKADESTSEYSSVDVQRIETLLEYVSALSGYDAVAGWLEANFEDPPSIEDFAISTNYASLRERAFNEIEGLEL